MVDLVREKIGVMLPITMTGGGKIKPAAKNSEPHENIVTKKILPLSLIAGGGLLIYYGVKGPNVSKFVKKMVNERISVIEKRVSDFADDAKSFVWEQFRASNGRIADYAKERVVNPKNIVHSVECATNLQEVLTAQDRSFDILQKEIYKDVRVGASDFDNFTSFLYSIRRNIGDNLNNKKHQINLANGDLIQLPPFKNGKHTKLLENISAQIDAKVKSGAEEMSEVIGDVFDKNIHEKSAEMAEVIIQKRDNFRDAKRLLLETSFAKVRQALGLSEDFVPHYNKIPTLENFSKLTPEELKPSELPNGIENILSGTMFGEILKSKDFSKLEEKSFRIMFLKMLSVLNVQDIGIMTDRLRLRAVVENNEDAYRVLIAKLEFLQNKIQQAGEKELFARLEQNFEGLSKEQKSPRFAHINDAARKLGYNSLEQMDIALSETHPEYLQTSFKKCIDEIKKTPELFFF